MTKTELLLLSRKRRTKRLENVVVKLRRMDMPHSEKVKYLGVWVDKGLTWRDYIHR